MPGIFRRKKPTKTILVVDDDPDSIDIIRAAAEAQKFTVEGASTAEEAIGILKKNGQKFCLIMMDVLLPGATGWTLRRQILDQWGEAPIVMMSGSRESFGFVPEGELVTVMVKRSNYTHFFRRLAEKK